MKKYLAERPWIWVVVSFVVLIGALASFVTTAVKNMPETVSLTGGVERANH
ncbi:hypothetical protein DES53_102857 [Roseimicrobium gellanilyticum]|uniref:Uncharacterized protein n=1 Tax=Roseimicrobium gellanilyticum TaxID=748857 RepID=A0A366HSI8_9BACT|nr:hypothetical protein [Roseimicrobium gellanilyticum]RBP46466.1 hypothetical protein DES53_102857 [Roseimicrobium gellanilyticum]